MELSETCGKHITSLASGVRDGLPESVPQLGTESRQRGASKQDRGCVLGLGIWCDSTASGWGLAAKSVLHCWPSRLVGPCGLGEMEELQVVKSVGSGVEFWKWGWGV